MFGDAFPTEITPAFRAAGCGLAELMIEAALIGQFLQSLFPGLGRRSPWRRLALGVFNQGPENIDHLQGGPQPIQ